MLRFIYSSAVLLGFALIIGAAAAWFAFGGGRHYPDLTTAPILGRDALEAAVVFERPIGNAAVAADGRIFFTVHPESHPENPKLYVWNDDEALPFPDAARQSELFQSPLGLVIDRRGRLWIIDPGHHGLGDPSLTAIDLASGEIVHRHLFNNTIAPPGSFLQDLQIDSNGRSIYIADVGFWAKRPALIVYDVEHQAVVKLSPDGSLETLIKDERIRWADGLSFGPDGWLYLADSAIPHLVLQSPSHIAGQSPFFIWRFKPGSRAATGQ